MRNSKIEDITSLLYQITECARVDNHAAFSLDKNKKEYEIFRLSKKISEIASEVNVLLPPKQDAHYKNAILAVWNTFRFENTVFQKKFGEKEDPMTIRDMFSNLMGILPSVPLSTTQGQYLLWSMVESIRVNETMYISNNVARIDYLVPLFTKGLLNIEHLDGLKELISNHFKNASINSKYLEELKNELMLVLHPKKSEIDQISQSISEMSIFSGPVELSSTVDSESVDGNHISSPNNFSSTQ